MRNINPTLATREMSIMAKLRMSLFVGVLALAGAACEAPVEPDASPTGTQAAPSASGDNGILSALNTASVTTNREVLDTFYHATGGPDWDNNTNWLSTQPLNTWYGVTADYSDQVQALHLQNNNLTDSLPVVLRRLTELEELVINGNENMSGEVPLEWAEMATSLMGVFPLLRVFHAHDTGICALPDPRMRSWLGRISDARVSYCEYFYLTQSVQSFDNPVPLVAGRRALLRVFVTADNGDGHNIPGVSAMFHYDDGSAGSVVKSPGSVPIPTDVDESDLSQSVNFIAVGSAIKPGMSISIEVDPDGDIPDSVNITRRIPTTGTMALDVRELDDLELTLIPFLYRPDPDYAVVYIASNMANHPRITSQMEGMRELHPFSDYDITDHAPVMVDTEGAHDLLNRTVVTRAAESGTGYWMGMITPVRTEGYLGIADSIPGWNSFATPLPRIIAHELGHNIGLRHALACEAKDPATDYPYPDGEIHAWGFDKADYLLVPPVAKDFMSYCLDPWVSAYHYAKMIRQLLDRDAHGGGTSAPTIIVWGGVSADGDPYLESSFLVDAMVSLPADGSEYRLRGMTAQGEEAFSFSFDMPEIVDSPDGQSGFVFAVPVSWTGELGEITLSGRGGSFTLNRETDQPLTILYDDAGQIRAILNAEVDEAMRSLPGVDVRPVFSRGIPR